MRVCLVYDCLFPHTIGGAERWYRNVAERLVAEGHEVTYLTLKQWRRGEDPGLKEVDVRAVGPRMRLYVRGASGRRRIIPPLVFGAGVLAHLLLRGRRYDVVHTASFPYFSVLAAAAARPLGHYRLVVDWHEVWSREYWQEYLGAAGAAGWWVQGVCARLPQRAFCFSRLHARRLVQIGLRCRPTVLKGEYAGGLDPPERHPAEPYVVFAGRLIPEKGAAALIDTIALARKRLPELTCELFGEGPEREEVERRVVARGLGNAVRLRGFAPSNEVHNSLGRALCMVLPSRREGYGMVVVEAAACGTPSVVAAEPDNAAVELVDEAENGMIARSARPADLADAIVRVHEAGPALREATAAWFARNAPSLSIRASLETVSKVYREGGGHQPRAGQAARARN